MWAKQAVTLESLCKVMVDCEHKTAPTQELDDTIRRNLEVLGYAE